MAESESLLPVSAEHDGRILTGVGVDVEDLHETMEARSKTPTPDVSPVTLPETTPAATETTTPKPTRGQKRFAELTSERDKAEHRATEAEKRIAALQAELETAKRLPSPPPLPAPAAVPVSGIKGNADAGAVATPGRAKPTEDQIGTVYQTYGDYVEDLADWKAEQRLTALNLTKPLDLDATIRQRIEADRASRAFTEHVQTTWTEARKVYPDFDAVIGAAKTPFSMDKLRAIALAPNSAHLQYALAKDEALAKELADEPDLIRFGIRLASVAPTAPAVSPASTGTTGTSTAPAPYQPVGGGSKTTVVPSADLVTGFDFDKSGYREKRAAERGVRRRP